MLPSLAFATIKERPTIPGLALRIEGQLHYSDEHGVILPSQIIKSIAGQLVTFRRTDGFKYDAQITEIEESDDYLKVYGKILNVEEANFGFVMARGGNFAGAVLEKKNQKTYVLKFSEPHKGFILELNNSYNKPAVHRV